MILVHLSATNLFYSTFDKTREYLTRHQFFPVLLIYKKREFKRAYSDGPSSSGWSRYKIQNKTSHDEDSIANFKKTKSNNVTLPYNKTSISGYMRKRNMHQSSQASKGESPQERGNGTLEDSILSRVYPPMTVFSEEERSFQYGRPSVSSRNGKSFLACMSCLNFSSKPRHSLI